MFTSSANPSNTAPRGGALAAHEDFGKVGRGTQFLQVGGDMFFPTAFAQRYMRGGLEAEACLPLRGSAVSPIGVQMAAWVRAEL